MFLRYRNPNLIFYASGPSSSIDSKLMTETNGVGHGANVTDSQSITDQNEPSQPAADAINPHVPPSSHMDNGLSKRPRDARLLHMVLANYGVSAYQERVPLQLMDFAYRYTSSTLQDGLHFTSEGYGTTGPATGSGKGAAHTDLSGITLSSLRLSIASRTHYQFNPTLPKEFYNEIAQERNRIALPPVSREYGVHLPPEQYCLTGVGWDLKEEFDEEMEETTEGDLPTKAEGLNENGGEDEDGGDEDVGRMEDIFGADNDTEMEE